MTLLIPKNVFGRIRSFWSNKVPFEVRELTYLVFGVFAIIGLGSIHPEVAGLILSIALLWGLLCVSDVLSGILKWILEEPRKMFAPEYGIPYYTT